MCHTMLTCAMILLCLRCLTLQNEAVVLSPRAHYPNHLPTQFHYDRVVVFLWWKTPVVYWLGHGGFWLIKYSSWFNFPKINFPKIDFPKT